MTDLFRFMHSILFRYVDRIGICPPPDRFFHRKGVQGRDLGTPRNPAPQVCQIVYATSINGCMSIRPYNPFKWIYDRFILNYVLYFFGSGESRGGDLRPLKNPAPQLRQIMYYV